MKSEFEYRFTEKAESDLDEIVAYIALKLANPAAASSFVDRLHEHIERISCFPQSGSPVQNEYLKTKDVRKVLVGNYIVYYLPDMETGKLFILRIVYGKRNLSEILAKLNNDTL